MRIRLKRNRPLWGDSMCAHLLASFFDPNRFQNAIIELRDHRDDYIIGREQSCILSHFILREL